MPRLIAFLRAVNVGGHIVKMDALRREFESLGFSNVETFIASGNVIFDSRSTNTSSLEKKIAERLRQAFGYEIAAFVRTDAEVAKVASYKPFKGSGTLNIAFLGNPLPVDAERILMSLKSDVDDFHVLGREVYWLCQVKQSESTFSNTVFEKLLKIKATFRGANTVVRLAAKYCLPAAPAGRKGRK